MELQIRYFCTPEPIYSMICALHGTYEHKRISYLHSAAWGRRRSSVRLALMEPRSQAAAVVRRREKGTRARDGGGGAVESWGGRYPRKIAGGASLSAPELLEPAGGGGGVLFFSLGRRTLPFG